MNHHADDPELAALFTLLRVEGYQCRAYQDETGIELLWKPKPAKMPEFIRERVTEQAAALACILVPNEPGPVRPMRPFWTQGSGQCVGCGHFTILTDPLGQIRHDVCGWLDNRLKREALYH